MDRLTRKELKHDQFVQEVGHTVEYVSEHRPQIYRYGAIGGAAVLAIVAGWLWFSHSKTVRQEELREALRQQDGAVGQGNPSQISFPTQEAKDAAVKKSFTELAGHAGSSDEGMIAHYYLGVIASDKGDLATAAKEWSYVADKASRNYASQAKFSLAQLYSAQGKQGDADKLLRDLIANPTDLVSSEQATLELGRELGQSNPAEARKLLEPLRNVNQRSAVSRAAITALSEIH